MRCHRHRDYFGPLVAQPGQTDGAGDLRQLVVPKTARVQTLAEGSPFGFATYQADKGQVGARALAQQAGGHDVQVFCMAKAHDQHARTRRQAIHRTLHRLRMLAAHIGGHAVGEGRIAAVYPVHIQRQMRKHLHQGMANMPAAKQGYRLVPGLQLLAQPRNISRAAEQAHVYEVAKHMLEDVGLYAKREMIANSLSRGDKRRLELAMCLAQEPKLLLLDEPTAGMSRADTNSTIDLLQRLGDGKVTKIIIEHDMHVVFSLAEKISVMAQGAIIAEGAPEAIKNDPRVQEAYLGGAHL